MSLLLQFAPQTSLGSIVDLTGRGRRTTLVPVNGLPPLTVGGGERSVREAQSLASVLLCDVPADSSDLGILEAGVDEHVDVCSPGLHTTSRFELVSALTGTQASSSACRSRRSNGFPTTPGR